MNWIKCSERMPEIRRLCLTYGCECDVYDIGEFVGQHTGWTGDILHFEEITHWAEITPPEE